MKLQAELEHERRIVQEQTLTKMQSDATLQDLLREAKQKWSKTDADLRSLQVAQKSDRDEISVLKGRLTGARQNNDQSRLAQEASELRGRFGRVQSELSAETRQVSELRKEIAT